MLTEQIKNEKERFFQHLFAKLFKHFILHNHFSKYIFPMKWPPKVPSPHDTSVRVGNIISENKWWACSPNTVQEKHFLMESIGSEGSS